jgi:HAD superfamily hydrolase (TIGR01484 family)
VPSRFPPPSSRFRALACDYDGTLASEGRVDAETCAALDRLRATGRRLILVTGRQLEDLDRVFRRLALFDRVVAENGALLYAPSTGEIELFGEPPPDGFIAALRARGVHPISIGRVIVATDEPAEPAVREVIRELGVARQVILNKGAVMVLPSGIDKASGVERALGALSLSLHDAVAIGDAENDLAMLEACGCGVAVANAHPALRARADLVTRGANGAGVAELIEKLN